MRSVRMLGVVAATLLICAVPVLAQTTPEAEAQARQEAAAALADATNWAESIGAGFGAGITILGAAFGISMIAGKAVESMARQPEVAGNIQGAMIISAALIEGVSFFALIVCILVLVL